MKIGAAYPSEFLKSEDLRGKSPKVTMSHVEMKDIGGEPKPVLYFMGSERGMVLNKTNAGRISDMYGDETDDWQGKPITLYVDRVDFQGRRVDAIRVKYEQAGGHHQAPTPTHAQNGNGASNGHSEPQTFESIDEVSF